jgi:hypothetical protein
MVRNAAADWMAPSWSSAARAWHEPNRVWPCGRRPGSRPARSASSASPWPSSPPERTAAVRSRARRECGRRMRPSRRTRRQPTIRWSRPPTAPSSAPSPAVRRASTPATIPATSPCWPGCARMTSTWLCRQRRRPAARIRDPSSAGELTGSAATGRDGGLSRKIAARPREADHRAGDDARLEPDLDDRLEGRVSTSSRGRKLTRHSARRAPARNDSVGRRGPSGQANTSR